MGDESIQKLRNTLRFLVSFSTEKAVQDLKIDEVTYDELMYLDQYMLLELQEFQNEVSEDCRSSRTLMLQQRRYNEAKLYYG